MTAQRMTTCQEPLPGRGVGGGGSSFRARGVCSHPWTCRDRSLKAVRGRVDQDPAGVACLTSMLSSLCHCPAATLISCCTWRDGCPERLCPCQTQATQRQDSEPGLS